MDPAQATGTGTVTQGEFHDNNTDGGAPGKGLAAKLGAATGAAAGVGHHAVKHHERRRDQELADAPGYGPGQDVNNTGYGAPNAGAAPQAVNTDGDGQGFPKHTAAKAGAATGVAAGVGHHALKHHEQRRDQEAATAPGADSETAQVGPGAGQVNYPQGDAGGYDGYDDGQGVGRGDGQGYAQERGEQHDHRGRHLAEAGAATGAAAGIGHHALHEHEKHDVNNNTNPRGAAPDQTIGANYGADGQYGQAPGNFTGAGNAQVPAATVAPTAATAGNVGAPDSDATTTSGGTGKIIGGRLQQAAGMLLSSDTLKAKGLEREAAGVAKRDVNEAQRLEKEAMARRERAVNHGAAPGNRALGGQNTV